MHKQGRRFLLLITLFVAYSNAWASYEQWMTELKPKLWNKPLTQILIPGTHNSASHRINRKKDYADEDSLPNWIRYIREKYPLLPIKAIYAGWAKNQRLTIYQQLAFGIRYIDIRLCYNSKRNIIESCHGMYSASLKSILNDVNLFSKRYPDELIILHFQHFYQFKEVQHKLVTQQLNTLFQTRLVPNTYNATTTAGELWQSPHRIITIYNHSTKDKPSSNLWASHQITSLWPHTSKIEQLKEQLKGYLKHRRETKLFVLQAILTPDKDMVVKGLPPLNIVNPGSIEQLAKQITPGLVDYLFRLKVGKKHNIVIFDWVEYAPDLMRRVVQYNQR